MLWGGPKRVGGEGKSGKKDTKKGVKGEGRDTDKVSILEQPW